MPAALPWFRFSDEALVDPKVQQLPPREFRRQLIAALHGERNAFARFIQGPFTSHYRLPAGEWRLLREAVFARDDYRCQYCGARGGRLECDHIVPVARGG